MNAANLQDRVVEFFTLREARRQIAAVPEETRSRVYRDLRIAFQRREAAETLWPRGSTAEALRLAADALETGRAALAAFPPEPHPAWLANAQQVAAEASKRLVDVRLPSLEADVQTGHEEIFRAMVDALIAIEEQAGVSLAAPSDLRRIGTTRIAVAAFAVVVLIAGLVRVSTSPSSRAAPRQASTAPRTGRRMPTTVTSRAPGRSPTASRRGGLSSSSRSRAPSTSSTSSRATRRRTTGT